MSASESWEGESDDRTESAVGLVGFYVNGAWEKPHGRGTLPVTNPATGDVLAEVPYAERGGRGPRRPQPRTRRF